MFTQPENGRQCHRCTGARFTQRAFSMCEKCVRVYSQHLHYILIKLIYSLLFLAPVSRNLKHSRLSGLGLSVFSCSFHWPAVNLTVYWMKTGGFLSESGHLLCFWTDGWYSRRVRYSIFTHDTAHHLYLALSDIMQLPWLSEISIMNHMHFHM